MIVGMVPVVLMRVCDVFIPTLRGRGRGTTPARTNYTAEASDIDNERSVKDIRM